MNGKTLRLAIKIAIAGAAFAGGAANAASLITNTGGLGPSDMVLFVTNTATNASFVQDLSTTTASVKTVTAAQADNTANVFYSASSEAQGGSATLPGPLSEPASLNYNSAALDSFLNGCAGHCSWTVLGTDQQSGGSTALTVFTSTSAPATMTSVNGPLLLTSNAGAAANFVNAFFASINGQGIDYSNNTSTVTGDGWLPGNSNDQTLNGQLNGPGSTGTGAAVGTAQTLYVISGAANEPVAQLANIYAGAIQGTLSADSGLTFGASAVPLPAAVWLLGSGLAGLAGIGRRRKQGPVAA
jgi:hypothetical protein